MDDLRCNHLPCRRILTDKVSDRLWHVAPYAFNVRQRVAD
jgi:hypothetical protein